MKKFRIFRASLFLVLLFSLKIAFSFAPKPKYAQLLSEEKVVDDKVNIIEDATNSLHPFLQAMQTLQQGKDTVLTIVHLGDSHIQAGFFGGQSMRLFHRGFGNAGRGWVSPLKLARLNEPADYYITSSTRSWINSRITQRKQKCPIGPGGIGIQSSLSSVSMNLIITPKNGAGYDFDQVLFFRDQKAKPMIATGKSLYLADRSLGRTPQAGMMIDTFRMLSTSDTLQLRSEPKTLGNSLYYGFLIKKNNSGIRYHNVGVNGAMYVHFTDPSYVKRLATLKPSLLIISLGTNETFGRNFLSSEFKKQVKSFLSLVKKEMPQTKILLTTPVECYKRIWKNRRRIYIRNRNTVLAAKTIAQVAAEEGIALWDLFTVAGGENSCEKWYKDRLYGRDRIHFTKEGYEKQGTLLFHAFIALMKKNGFGLKQGMIPSNNPHPLPLKQISPTLK